MRLSPEQLRTLGENGFLTLPQRFSVEEVAALNRRIPSLWSEETDANIQDASINEVRIAMALHQRDDLFARLAKDPRLIAPAQQIYREPFYIQQTQLNTMRPMSSQVWQWHHNFGSHHEYDGVARPLALNIHVFLDTVTPFNGPICFIPGSHMDERGHLSDHPVIYDDNASPIPTLTVTPEALEIRIKTAEVRNNGQGIVAATGQKGTVLIFFDTTLHCSSANFSPWDRSIFSMIVNPISNPSQHASRPDYLHHKDTSPVVSGARPDLFDGIDQRAIN